MTTDPEPTPRYWDPREGSRIDDVTHDIDARLAEVAARLLTYADDPEVGETAAHGRAELQDHVILKITNERTPTVADKFLDQLKADVEAAKAEQLAKSQQDDRGKAFLDKITAEVKDAGGKPGK